MNTAAKDSQPSGLRVSDADRDRALAELSEHFQAGRLTADEHEERMSLALKARTAGDLAELFTDLPRKPSAMAGPAPRSAGLVLPPASSPPARFSHVPLIPVVILAAVVLGGIFSGHPFVIGVGPIIIVLLIVRGLLGGGRRHHDHDWHHDRHHDHDWHHDRHHDHDWHRDHDWDRRRDSRDYR
jgi:uncharacterized protein DUF1707